jgi:ssRNA-specific RNase YbeY (16S rRNA maturation enzyme)
VKSNADMLGVPYENELMRVIIHGVLHLCGITTRVKASVRSWNNTKTKHCPYCPKTYFRHEKRL